MQCSMCGTNKVTYYNVCQSGTGRFTWCKKCKETQVGYAHFKLISEVDGVDGPPMDAPMGTKANVKTPTWFDLLPE